MMKLSSLCRMFLFLIVISILGAATTAAFGEDADSRAFLNRWGIRLNSDEGFLRANLVTIIPTSKRLIVKSAEEGDKTVVLALSDSFQVVEGKMARQASDLQRGEELLIVVDVRSKAVKGIYKYF